MFKFNSLISVVVLSLLVSACSDESPATATTLESASNVPKSTAPPACDSSTVITGNKYNVIGSDISVRSGAGKSFDKVVNQKATSIIGSTQYITIEDSTTVFEECTKDGWSWIRVIEPDYLQNSHRGWVQEKVLDKGQDIGGDKYTRKISSSALLPYTKKDYPKTIAKYGSRLAEIEKLRRKAAEMAIDSGKCDYVLSSELSDSKSELRHLHFLVDCKNSQRVYLDEFQIQKSAPVLTQQEKAWTKESALTACRDAIKSRALIPSEVDIHSVLGTSFYEAPKTHNVVLKMDFDAKNALGGEIPYTATCHFAPGEIGTIEIQIKQ